MCPSLLKEIAPPPPSRRRGVLRDLAIPAGTGQFGPFQAVAASLAMELSPIGMRDAGEEFDLNQCN